MNFSETSMMVENIYVGEVLTPHYLIPIVGDGACLFRAISYAIYKTENQARQVRDDIVEHVVENWDEFSIMSHDNEGNNYLSAGQYAASMSLSHTYGGLCELKAAGRLYPFLIEIYYDGKLYGDKYGLDTNPVRRLRFTADDLSEGHFDVYIPLDDVINMSTIEENQCNILIKGKKRRARYTNATRKKQLSMAAEMFNQNHPEAHRAAVAKHQRTHTEDHRAAVAEHQRTHPEAHRAAVAEHQRNHPEAHRHSQALYEMNNSRVRTNHQLRPWKQKSLTGMSYNPEIAYENNIGSISNNKCKFCNALKWKGEPPGMCCGSGKVQLAPLDLPPEPLFSLLKPDHPHYRHFMDHIRQYNGCFQMTSFGAKQIVENSFMPTFKVQGQVYHLHGSLLPQSEEEPKFLQIYFVGDNDTEARIRSRHFQGVKEELVEQLQKMIHDVNIYVKDFKSTIDRIPPDCNNFQVVINADRKPANAHSGRFNVPTASEVAVVIVGQQFDQRDIVLHNRDSQLRRINELHRSYDALQYPLMFCYGEDGYSIDINQHDPITKLPLNKTVSAASFYSYRIMIREGEDNCLLRFGSLLSQYLVDEYAKIETEKLNFLRYNQSKLRAEQYIHLKDATSRHDVDADQLGRVVVLPSSFTGGPRYMHERAQDAMTYVRHFGSSDLFITFTCNPKWNEIHDTLYPRQKYHERHDIIARVFRRKIKDFMDLIVKGELFGKVRCFMFTVEWQKRGLPHIHVLLWLQDRISPNNIDNVVSAEIPDPEQDSLLYNIIKNNMIHGPCGSLNKNSPCMVEGTCSKKYPRQHLKETQIDNNGYPKYRRRSKEDGGFTVNVRGMELDNRWVVPFNPVLSRTFQAHINVEISASVKSIKYICKYITKGSDQAAFRVVNDEEVDEIQIYESGRYISSSEAVWRILGFPIHERYPAVTHLDVHLENGQRVYFTATNLSDKLTNPPKTTLLSFFDLCQNDNFAKGLLYSEVPSYYVLQQNKVFTRRKRGEDVKGWPGIKKDSTLGRVYTIHPNNVECYHLRLLLHTVRGPKSFSELKTYDGIEYPTFKAACQARGLLEDDKQWEFTLEEAAVSRSAYKIRELFSIILVFCQTSNPSTLWEKYKDILSEDITYQENDSKHSIKSPAKEVYNRCLILIENTVLAVGGLNLNQYGLPHPIRSKSQVNREFLKETSYNIDEMTENVLANSASLTDEQNIVYQQVITCIESNIAKIFFLDAPGGTGKTFLINLLLAKVRSTRGIALAVASSGIAATLLDGGRTAHSTFKLPLNLNYNDTPICHISKQSNMAKVLQHCKLIIWDESTMANKCCFEALNNTLKDIRNSDELMGGVTVLLAGDFRQTLPIVPRGTRANEVNACIKASHIWPKIQKLSLKKNMRVHLRGDASAEKFSELLLKIGDGKYPESQGKITIPSTLCTVVSTLKELIDKIYPNISSLRDKSTDWLCERAILTPKNDAAADINNILLKSLKGESIEYNSIDSVLDVDAAVHYPIEFLNTLTPPGLPAHTLLLKIGAPIILLRNICPPKLCNGTRLRVVNLQKNLIEAIIITGCGRNESVLIPRIPLIPSDYPFEFKRLQFPVRACFAMSINKSQGQSLKAAGIDLRESCFSHGQLYVACSRVSSSSDLVILCPEKQTNNVVYKEVFYK